MTATLTAASGYVLNLNSAAFAGNWGSSSTGPASFDVRSSVDNYASSLGTISSSASIAYTSLTLPASGYNGLSSITFRFIGSATAAGGGSTGSSGTGGPANFYVGGSVGASTITGAATASAFTTTYGTASTAQTFSVSGANLIANLTATAPAGFEVSSDGTTYGATATFTQSGGTASGSLRIRLAATATVSGSYNSQNVVLSSTGASSVNITTASSGNSVTANATLAMSVHKNAAADLLKAKVFVAAGLDLGSAVLDSAGSATLGTLSASDTKITYTAGGTTGSDNFNCVVHDSGNVSKDVQVNVTVVDPNDPNQTGNGSNLAIRVLDGGEVRVIIAGTADKTYHLQYTDSISPPDWQNFGSAFTMPASGIQTIDDSGGSTSRYYRTTLP